MNITIDNRRAKDATAILRAIEQGDDTASSCLLPLVYEKLRSLAKQKMAGEPKGHTLNATDLVHEAFIRLVDCDNPQSWDSVGHFYIAAAESMRRILIEIARRKRRIKHGGEFNRLDCDEVNIQLDSEIPKWSAELLDLDEALVEFAKNYPEEAKLVELRYFAGLNMMEAAKVLKISRRTAQRYWAFAKAWLFARMSDQVG